MSYALTLPMRGFGASATEIVKAGADAADIELPDCSSAAITGNEYIDSTFVNCCKDIKKMSGLSVKEKAKGIGECIARGAATAACLAVSPLTYGATGVLAPLCGTVGAFVFERVAGWDTTQWITAAPIGAFCAATGPLAPACSLAGAELVGWLSDNLGPVLEGVFNPSAAKERELKARAAAHALSDAREETLLRADASMRQLWSDSIHSIKTFYTKALATLPAAYRNNVQSALGFGPTYDGIAKALVASGARSVPLDFKVDGKGSTVADRIRSQKSRTGHGCESTAEGCLGDGYSEVCPFSFTDMYFHVYYAQGMDKLTGNTRDKRVSFDKQMLPTLQSAASGVLAATNQAITLVTTKILTTVSGVKQQSLLYEAQRNTKSQLATKAASAASAAEAAADAALHGDAKEGAAAIARAKQNFDIANKAMLMLLDSYGARDTPELSASVASRCASDTYCNKAGSAVRRAKVASELAVTNAAKAATRRLVFGGAVAAGVAGAIYLMLRK